MRGNRNGTSGYNDRLRIWSQRKCHRQKNRKKTSILNFIIVSSLTRSSKRSEFKRYHGKSRRRRYDRRKGAEGDVRGSFSKYADLTDRAIHVQKQIIRKLAEKRACVIIGRSADYILKDTKGINLLRAFIYAPDSVRIHNIMESHSLSEKKMHRFFFVKKTNDITNGIWH